MAVEPTVSSSTVSPPNGKGYRADIQGLRAIAVLFVVIYHAGLYFPGGFVGVDIFFVISGFVITAMLKREWDRHGRIDFQKFYVKRIKRLMPALALVIVVTLLVSALVLSPLGTQQQAAQTAFGAIFLASNVVIARTTGGYFDAPAESNPLLNLWSLSVEEQFYLVFPLLLAGAWLIARRFSQRSAPTAVLGAASLVSLAVAMWGAYAATAPAIDAVGLIVDMLTGFYSPVTRVWEFGVGAVLALHAHRVTGLGIRGATIAGGLGLGMLLASAWLITGDVPFPGLWTLLPVIGSALLLVAGSRPDTVTSRALSSKGMVLIGDWSYSIYLWHWPMIVFARVLSDGNPIAIVSAAVLSFVPAYVSYRWVEEPIRKMKLPTLRSVAALVVATLLPPFLIAGGLLYASGQGFWSPRVQMYQSAAADLHAGAERGCHTYAPLSDEEAAKCSWNTDEVGAPIYLIGDSHADHLSEAVIAAGASAGRPVVISSTPNCPPVRGHLERTTSNPALNSACQVDMASTLDYLATMAPSGLVVMTSGSNYWTNDTVRFGPDSTSATNEAGKLRLYEQALRSTVEELKAAGHGVLLAQSVPGRTGSYSWDPTSCSLPELTSTPARCGVAIPLAVANEEVGEVRRIVKGVASVTGAGLLDPGVAMCPEGLCGVEGDGFARLKDSVHISVDQSEALAPLVEQALVAMES